MIKLSKVSSSHVLQTRAGIGGVNRAAFLVVDCVKDGRLRRASRAASFGTRRTTNMHEMVLFNTTAAAFTLAGSSKRNSANCPYLGSWFNNHPMLSIILQNKTKQNKKYSTNPVIDFEIWCDYLC